jgi:hypothetical protein
MDILIGILLTAIVTNAPSAAVTLVVEVKKWFADRGAISRMTDRPIEEPALFFEVTGRDVEE